MLLGGSSSVNPVADDAAVAAKVAAARAPLEALSNQVVGQLTTPLVGHTDRKIGRNQETNTGNLVCTALAWAASTLVSDAGA